LEGMPALPRTSSLARHLSRGNEALRGHERVPAPSEASVELDRHVIAPSGRIPLRRSSGENGSARRSRSGRDIPIAAALSRPDQLSADGPAAWQASRTRFDVSGRSKTLAPSPSVVQVIDSSQVKERTSSSGVVRFSAVQNRDCPLRSKRSAPHVGRRPPIRPRGEDQRKVARHGRIGPVGAAGTCRGR
jgi:hypothetical protein